MFKVVRKLYDWILSWAETPWGGAALFVLAFCESVFFPVPPDPLLMALILGMPRRAWRFAIICSVASIAGGMTGYALGQFAWWNDASLYTPALAQAGGADALVPFTALAKFFFNHIPGFTTALFESVRTKYDLYGFWIVFTAGFTPIPYKVITITSGAFGISFPIFLLASAISRSLRFFLLAVLLWKFGEPIRNIIDKYFNGLCILFTVLLIGGFAAFKYLF
ncbi:MAG: cytochrome B [Candidatus Wallbacteria bacterium HGW-Wallbacteria-1]|uniref:Cytochrome B n=1 Tax=Candidatus Wallbacteria bacterium HGW-Wallbacteria-1 TaxID=2013854 RepID=A0A2N1PII6_9BACT|nr:MAG: cytochrome B [Candidatus Wallbacteria bacterium HGW-Wallbacteria-1]